MSKHYFKASIRGLYHKLIYANGSKASGLDFFCATEQGALSVRLYRQGSNDMLEISLQEHEGKSEEKQIFYGKLDAKPAIKLKLKTKGKKNGNA